MHFNYRDDAKHYLQKKFRIPDWFFKMIAENCNEWNLGDDTSSICLCKHVSISFHLLTKYQGAQANQLKSIFSTSYQKIKKFENRIKLYSSYFEDGVQLFKYIFPKAMKIPFLSSIFIIILASSCDVLCHWIFCYWLYGWSVTSKLLFSEMKS